MAWYALVRYVSVLFLMGSTRMALLPISTVMKTIIPDEYKMKLELVPTGFHCRNAEEVAIRNFKAHFLSVLAGTAEIFPL